MANVTLKEPKTKRTVAHGDVSYPVDGHGLVRVPQEAAGHLVARGGFVTVDPKVALICALANRMTEVMLTEVAMDWRDELIATQAERIAALEMMVAVRQREIRLRALDPGSDKYHSAAADEPDPHDVVLDAQADRVDELVAELDASPLPPDEPPPKAKATKADKSDE